MSSPSDDGANGRRGLIPGCTEPGALIRGLPQPYQDDGFALRLVDAFDESLAPLFSCLDNIDAYFDPRLAPPDFVDWLGGWLGLEVSESSPPSRPRDVVAEGIDALRWRGTLRGLSRRVELLTGAAPELTDSGGTVSSTTPGAQLPGSNRAELVVRIRVADPSAVDVAALEALVAFEKPAHVAVTVEVLPT